MRPTMVKIRPQTMLRRPSGPVRPPEPDPLVGQGQWMEQLRHEIARIAATDFAVLIEGESGSGKELVARHVHAKSARRTGPFVIIHATQIVDALHKAERFGIEERIGTSVRARIRRVDDASGGTLFLDDIADLSEPAQTRLAQVLDEMTAPRFGSHGTRARGVRLIVATDRSLRPMVEQQRFRADLYYRMSGLEIHVPPLRLRPSDIPLLAHYFLRQGTKDSAWTLSPGALDALIAHDWPGNVRQLRRVMEHAVAFSTGLSIGLADLPGTATGEYAVNLESSLVRDESMRAWGSRYARIVLDRCGNNKRRACDVLGISFHTLQSYLRYGRPAPDQTVAPPPHRRDGAGSRPALDS